MQTKNTKCAICFIPPIDRLSYIQSIRSEYDVSYERWMPHINLVFPFIDSEHINSVSEKLQSIFKDVKPFEISFDRFESFSRKKDATVHLIPECDENQINTIHEMIQLTLGLTPDPRGYQPHMTIGQFNKAELSKCMEQLSDEFEGHEFTYMCKEIYIIEREDNTPFSIKKIIKLG